jgi:hypothetical protein
MITGRQRDEMRLKDREKDSFSKVKLLESVQIAVADSASDDWPGLESE